MSVSKWKFNRMFPFVRPASLTLLALILLSVPHFCYAVEVQTWMWRKPLPQANDLTSIAFGQNTFVAVGLGGTIMRQSADGVWDIIAQKSARSYFGIAFAGGKFVVVGSSGTIVTSTGATDWAERVSGTTKDLHSVHFLNGLFIAVGNEGTLLTSSDGISWAQRQSQTDFNLSSVAFGNGRFVAVGYRCGSIACFEGVVITSTNGVDWVKSTPSPKAALYSIIFGNSTFVASGSNGADTGPGDGTIYISTDGTTWTQTINNVSSSLRVADFSNGTFRVIGGDTLISSNALDWTAYPMPSLQPINGLTYANGTFVGVGWKGSILQSSDGIGWSPLVAPDFSFHSKAAYGHGTWVFLDGFRIWASTNGINWRFSDVSPVGPNPPGSLCFAQNMFVGISADGTVFLSSDGLKWETLHPPEFSQVEINTIGFGQGRCFAAGRGILATSADARSWNLTLFQNGDLRYPSSIISGDGVIVLTTELGEIFSSENGGEWSKRTNPSDKSIFATAFNQHRFVAVGGGGTAIYSFDGTNWLSGSSATTNLLWSVAATSNLFTAVGVNGTIVSSPDGAIWQRENSKFSGVLLSIAQNGTIFLCVGESGTVLQSSSRTSPVLAATISDNTFHLRLYATGWSNSEIETSTGLMNWVPLKTFDNSLTNAATGDFALSPTTNRFFRTRSYP